ncbi:DUF934 domain-containing protein [Methylolobus aquaticus]
MVIVKDGRAITDEWLHLDDQAAIPPSGQVTVSLLRWHAERTALMARPDPVGLRLEAGDAPDTIADDLQRFPLIVLSFATMADGRLFSLARLLRERFGFARELRARGDFILDQIFFLSRVGVDTFEPTEDISPEAVGQAITTFSVLYQAATDEKQPLYRRARR